MYKVCALPLCSSLTLLHVGKVQLMTRGFSHNSSLYTQFEARQHSGILLGDRGYAQTNILFTPHLYPVRPEQQRYNQAHIHTRGLVERMFGIWKNRFQCLRNTCRFEPRRCCIVFIATAVLHHFLKQRDPLIEDDPHVPMAEIANDRNGLAYRDAFALQHFYSYKKNVSWVNKSFISERHIINWSLFKRTWTLLLLHVSLHLFHRQLNMKDFHLVFMFFYIL